MAYSDKDLKRAANGLIAPNVYNESIDDWEVIKGSNGAFDVNIRGSLTDFKNAAVTVTSTPTELKADTTAMAGRRQLIVYPPPAGMIYWGTSTVTTSNGAPLAAGDQPIVFDINPYATVGIYAVNDGTNRDVRVVESK